MPCYNPVVAYRLGCGSISFSERGDVVATLSLPCGRCIGCRLARSQEWASRCTHEAMLHENNCFVTLTYDDENLPEYGTLDHRDVQLFIKRLRKNSGIKFRYFMCGEYGETYGRAHYHLCLFGIDFADRIKFAKAPSGEYIYESALLSKTWGKGHAVVSPFSTAAAGYTARYSLKKVMGDAQKAAYSVTDKTTGEVHFLRPPYLRCSTNPGIGYPWFEKFHPELLVEDNLIIDGRPYPLPRYYDKLLKRKDVLILDDLKTERQLVASKKMSDNTPARLLVKEAVTMARVSQLKRTI